VAKTIYVYKTSAGIKTISTGEFSERPAYQNGIKTASGYLVPPSRIPGIVRIKIPDSLWNITEYDNLGTKGTKAVAIVRYAIVNGLFPIAMQAEEVSERDLQISGTDIIVSAKAHIQVKCDYKGGEGGTGNLYLQTAECNPFKIY
jgi:hypothetical protein